MLMGLRHAVSRGYLQDQTPSLQYPSAKGNIYRLRLRLRLSAVVLDVLPRRTRPLILGLAKAAWHIIVTDR